MRRCRQCRLHNIPKEAPKTQFVCGIECSMAYGRKHRESMSRKAERAKHKESKLKKREFYSNDVAKQKALTQAVANKLCMLLDKGKPCISSGAPDDGVPRKRNASHFKSRGSNSFLRYSMLNLHAATAHDNNFKSGNIEGYRQGLKERYGQWIVDYLDNAPRVREWECHELIALRKEYNAEIRRIESGQGPSRDWRSIEQQEQVA